jgi:hypothetical protein
MFDHPDGRYIDGDVWEVPQMDPQLEQEEQYGEDQDEGEYDEDDDEQSYNQCDEYYDY